MAGAGTGIFVGFWGPNGEMQATARPSIGVGDATAQKTIWQNWLFGASGTTQNITMTIAAIHLTGFPLGTNAKSQLTAPIAALALNGRTHLVNAKSQLTLPTATILFTGRALGVAGTFFITMATATINLGGLALAFLSSTTLRLLQRIGVGN